MTKLLRFNSADGPRLGRLVGPEEVTELDLPVGDHQGVELLLDGGTDAALERIEAAAGETRSLSDLALSAPVPWPSKVFGVGLNYADHVSESNMEMPTTPAVFTKFPNSIAGPGDAILRPRVSGAVDYEGELCVVIGRECRNVPASRAAEVIGGYTILNDVSVRDLQLQTQHWSLGKSFDTHGPTGPYVALPDQIDVASLDLRTWVNDDLRQVSSTRHLIFDCPALVEFISSFCTLYPGDLIATGTPGGVGGAMNPPRYLEPGDVVRIEIEGIGTLVNPVGAEPAGNVRIGKVLDRVPS